MRAARAMTVVAVAAVFLALPGVAHANCGGLLGFLLGQRCSPGPAAPDPGGTESPDQSVPVAGKHFGFNSLLSITGIASAEEELDAARGAGATVHRLPVSWAGMQPSPASPPLPEPAEGNLVSRVDAFYAEALARGITPIFITFSAPVWASRYRKCGLLDLACQWMARSSVNFVPDRPFLDEYEDFVRAVKSRWPRALIESWNEPNHHWNHPYFDGPRKYAASPRHFVDIQCAAYRASHAVNDDPVLAAGWAWHRFSSYVGAVYEAGGDDCWDIANVHLYSEDETELGENTWFARRLHEARELRSRHGDTDPIWVTEIGWTTSGSRRHRVSLADQADVSRRAYNRLTTMPDVEAVVFHTLRDAPAPGATDPSRDEYGFGMLQGDWRPKPVYCHFAGQAGNRTEGCGT